MMPSKHLILCCPLLLPSIFLNIWIFSNKSVLHIRWPKYWSFSFSISPSKEFSELISLGLTALIFLLSKELSSVLSSTTVQKHQFLVISLLYDPILTSVHKYWKNYSLIRWTIVGRVMSLLFNMLSWFVIAFLPRN